MRVEGIVLNGEALSRCTSQATSTKGDGDDSDGASTVHDGATEFTDLNDQIAGLIKLKR